MPTPKKNNDPASKSAESSDDGAKQPNPPLSYPALYEKYLPVAMAVPAEKAATFRGDARIVFVNLRLGIKSVLGDDAMIAFAKKHLPELPIAEMLELPDLGRALVIAARRVIPRAVSQHDIATKLNLISQPREDMLSTFETLARRGKVSIDTARQIRSGSGKLDTAQDVVDLVHEFTKEWDRLAGKHPFDQEELALWGETAEWLVENLNPEGARTAPKTKNPASDVRDRFAAVIQSRHVYLRRLGFYKFDDAFDQHVPRLLSRVTSTVTGEEELEGVGEEGDPSIGEG